MRKTHYSISAIFVIWIALFTTSTPTHAQADKVLDNFKYDDFNGLMSTMRVKALDYESDVYRLAVNYYLDSVTIQRSKLGKRKIARDKFADTYQYTVTSPVLDTVFVYKEISEDSTLVIKEVKGKTISATRFGHEFCHSHDFNEGEMDLKYFFYNLHFFIHTESTRKDGKMPAHSEFPASPSNKLQKPKPKA